MRATIVSRQPISDTRERVKITVTLNDGMLRSYWPYKVPGEQTDAELIAEAIAWATASLVAEADTLANQPVEREELDAYLVTLKEAGLIDADNWDDAKGEALTPRVVAMEL